MIDLLVTIIKNAVVLDALGILLLIVMAGVP